MGLGDKIKHAADELLHGHGARKQETQDRDLSEFPEAEPMGAANEDPDLLDDPHPDLDEAPLDDAYDPDEDAAGGSFTGPVPEDPIERIASPREDKPPAL
ncbi:hypothetical protein D477_014932 [Arthrobacter crystallopoietes BAB-32]|uniref:Uncharacterized protein n=1 Tax=Arthrobacter crystallopoietes BAB-32 TaxID=1246476 RepID=N1USL7_9MICC|nr:hypothetical protein [Arthrobacter crystallopoietes]EMY33401.1 hypothetical protein D477_014932 [Arthrobacter crystallopoietes BAB-32]